MPPPVDPHYPFSAFAFSVEIWLPEQVQNVERPLCRAAFAECDGLEITMEAKTLREGGNNDRQLRLTGPLSYGQLTLKRGMSKSFDLWTWFTAVQSNPRLRASVEVAMLSPGEGENGRERTALARFALARCLPVKLKAPALNAKDGMVAVEELQVAYEMLSLVRPSTGGSG